MFLFLFLLLIIFFFAATLWKSNYISAELLFSKSILMHRAFSWGNAYTSLKNLSACFFRNDWKMTFQWPCHTSDFWKIRPFFETPRLRIEDLSNRRSFFNVAIWVAQFTLSSRLWFEAICASAESRSCIAGLFVLELHRRFMKIRLRTCIRFSEDLLVHFFWNHWTMAVQWESEPESVAPQQLRKCLRLFFIFNHFHMFSSILIPTVLDVGTKSSQLEFIMCFISLAHTTLIFWFWLSIRPRVLVFETFVDLIVVDVNGLGTRC